MSAPKRHSGRPVKKGWYISMNTEKNMGFATRQIHVGKVKNAAGSLCDPIYQTSTFEFETVEQGGARFAGQESGYIYSRLSNPTVATVEAKLASLGAARLLWPPLPVWVLFLPLCGALLSPATRSSLTRPCMAAPILC